MKKKFYLLAVLALTLVLLPGTAWAAVGDTFDDGTLCYKLISDNEAEVTGLLKALDANGVLTIPEMVEYNDATYTITEIGNKAFMLQSNSLSDEALSIKRLDLPNTLTGIGYNAFNGCINLEGSAGQSENTLILPDSIEHIGFGAFQSFVGNEAHQPSLTTDGQENRDPGKVNDGYCQPGLISNYITSVHLPENLQTMGNSVFRACANLETIEIPGSLKALENGVFCDCFKLQSVTLNEGLKQIGETGLYGSGIFAYCKSLKTITLPDSVEVLGFTAFTYSGLTEITLPPNLQTIWNGAFCACRDLETINWNDKLAKVASNAFEDCTGLQTVTVPAGIAEFDPKAFNGCTGTIKVSEIPLYAALENYKANTNQQFTVEFAGSLANVIFEDGDFKYIIVDEENKLVQLMGVKEGVNLTGALDLPAKATYADLNQEYTVTEIGNSVFAGRTELTAVNLPDTLFKIGDDAFKGCVGLTALSLPDSLETIGAQAFYECENLTEMVFSTNLSSIGDWAFYKCGITEANLAHTQLKKIGELAFQKSALQNVVLPDCLTDIGSGAFKECSGLQEANLPANLISMGNEVFYNCNQLVKVEFPTELQLVELPQYTFSGCINLADFVLPASIKKIDMQAFSNCQNLQNFTLPEGLVELDRYAFYCCAGLGGGVLELPASITTIGQNAFAECDIERLTVVLDNNLQNLANDAFAGVQLVICYDKSTLEKLQSAVGEGTQVKMLYDLASVSITPNSLADEYYTGQPICPEIILSSGEGAVTFVKDVDYTITYTDNTEIGRATLTILACEDGQLYGKPVVLEFNIVERPAEIVTITFAGGEGSGQMRPVEVERGGQYTLPACGFTAPEGKEFAGWAYLGQIYQAGALIEKLAVDITLTATWQDKPEEPTPPVIEEYWTITFALNGGTLNPATQTPVKVKKGLPYTLPGAIRAGYKLQHWQIGADNDNTAAANSAYTFTADTTVYAIWQEDKKPEKPSGGGGSSHRPSRPQQPTTPTEPTKPNPPGDDQRPVSEIFADLQPNAWYIEAITKLYRRGIMQGNVNGTFAPNDNISRAMFVQLLYNNSGRPAGYGSKFADVAADSWYAPAIGWAQSNGLVLGYTAERFAPDEGITREQLVVMLWRYAGQPQAEIELSFTDKEQVGNWAKAAWCWAAAEGIVIGDSAGAFAPQNMATRAEAAQMLVRYLALIEE